MTPIEFGLLASAAGIGIGHALLGPDHAVPFVALAKTHRWTLRKTLAVANACGVAHVGAAWLLGLIVMSLGASTSVWAQTLKFQSQWAGWGLVLFGALYFVWGLRAAFRREETKTPGTYWTWLLFLLFVFGPCEPLLPFLAAAKGAGRPELVSAMTLIFGIATLIGMSAGILMGLGVLSKAKFSAGRWSPALPGGAILLSGLAVKFAGL
jgi:nickel/cobalt exporter